MNYLEQDHLYAQAEMQAETFEEFLAALQRLDLGLTQLDTRTWEFNYLTTERTVKLCARQQSDSIIWLWNNRELVLTDEGRVWQQLDSMPVALDGQGERMSMSDFLGYMVTAYIIEKKQDI